MLQHDGKHLQSHSQKANINGLVTGKIPMEGCPKDDMEAETTGDVTTEWRTTSFFVLQGLGILADYSQKVCDDMTSKAYLSLFLALLRSVLTTVHQMYVDWCKIIQLKIITRTWGLKIVNYSEI